LQSHGRQYGAWQQDGRTTGAQSAIRFTKHALNNWLRQMGPTFDTSLALEFLGFAGDEPREGVRSHKEKRAPKWPDGSPL
jgi:enoyl-CoA hydratase